MLESQEKNSGSEREEGLVMTPTLISQEIIIVDEPIRKEAAMIVDEACDSPLDGLFVTFDGSSVRLPDALTHFLVHILERTAEGGAMTVKSMPEELTTTVAADLLGVSRPTLMKLISAGDIKSLKVGRHTRLRSVDVLALKAKRSEGRRRAFEELRAVEEELGEI